MPRSKTHHGANHGEHKRNPMATSEGRIVARLEAMTGKPLSPEQRLQVHAAIQERNAAIAAAMQQCLGRISQITGLSPDQIRAREQQQAGAYGGYAAYGPAAH